MPKTGRDKSKIKDGYNKSASISSSSKKKKENNDYPKWKKNCIYVTIGLSVLGIVGFLLKTHFSDKTPTEYKIQDIIRQFIDFSQQQNELELQISIFLVGDPLVDIMKNELRPIQERVTSLRTQTSQYEKMEHIPGGPTSFMTTSLKELENIGNQLFDLTEKVFDILADIRKVAKSLSETGEELLKINFTRLHVSKEITSLMWKETVILVRVELEKHEQKMIERLAEETTLEEVIDMLNNLANRYDQLDEIRLKGLEMAKELGLDVNKMEELNNLEMTDDISDRILPLLDEYKSQREVINMETYYMQEYFALFSHLNHKTREKIEEMMNSMVAYEVQRREGYLKLHEMIQRDADNLKTRIQNLQYKYAKRISEL